MSILQNNAFTFQDENSRVVEITGPKTFRMDGESSTCVIDQCVLYIDGYEIPFEPCLGHIGGSFWLSSVAMCLFIFMNKHMFARKTVLELGAGLALPSQYLSRLGITEHIVASDVRLDRLPCWGGIECRLINWRSLDANDHDKFDIVLAADCVYGNTVDALLDALCKYLRLDSMVIVINPIRDNIEKVGYKLSELFDGLTIQRKTLYVNSLYIELLMFSN